MALLDYGIFHMFDFQYTICKTRKPKGIHTYNSFQKLSFAYLVGLLHLLYLLAYIRIAEAETTYRCHAFYVMQRFMIIDKAYYLVTYIQIQ